MRDSQRRASSPLSRPELSRDEPSDLTPAERFAAASVRAAYPLSTSFASGFDFPLDSFQRDACQAFERGENVLVCAPTGAGKTVVGEFAASAALAADGRCFYTTPIKALSNQKFAELKERFGDDSVGLLTGDTSINPHASVVVMTTEVLRNMLYAQSPDLDRLSAVVLDEIHFLADKFRGAVWEEVILHLADRVQVVGLSATVSNAEEFGEWIRTVRGPTTVIVDEVRPVPLWQHMMVGSRLYDLYAHAVGDDGSEAQRHINPALTRAVAHTESGFAQRAARQRRSDGGRGGPRAGQGRARRNDDGPRWRPAPRPLVIQRLDGAGLLPAIVFVFSRAGCDAAVDQCVRAGVDLVDADERAAIADIVRRHTARLPREDLEALDLSRWAAAWRRGVASHHAGLLPAFKEAVEEMFATGLIKAVFATETLALGINMPARTVVLERLVKFDGESHADITPGEYTQLTGRAGRRGIDIEGHAVVMWSPHLDVNVVAGLASTRTFPMRSSFQPTYNMAVNLVDRMGLEPAGSLLEQSFAQFQADRTVVGRARQADANRREMAVMQGEMQCELGDVAEYTQLVVALAASEKATARARASQRRSTAAADLAALRRGDIIRIDKGRRSGIAVVLDARPGPAGDVRPLVVTEGRWSGRVTRSDFRGRIPVLGTMKLRKYVDHASSKVRADLAAALVSGGFVGTDRSAKTGQPGAIAQAGALVGRADEAALREAVRTHPVHSCSDVSQHLALARRLDRLATQTAALDDHVRTVRGSMSRALAQRHAVLVDRHYFDGDRATGAGRRLQRIWLELDLLAAECLGSGQWSRLEPAELAGVVSGLVFEGRGGAEIPATALNGGLGQSARDLMDRWRDLTATESEYGVPAMRRPDFGFAATVAAWTSGASLLESLAHASLSGVELTGGDFVRWCRQVLDALDQLRHAGGSDAIPAATSAIERIARGVVVLGSRQ